MSSMMRLAIWFKTLKLHFVYLIVALPSAIFLSIATPPFQTPDAANHFFRVVQVATGGWVAEAQSGTSGGRVDRAAVAFARLYEPLAFHPDVKVSAALAAQGNSLKWSGVDENVGFPNTAIYPAYSYAPQVAAVALGRALHLSVQRTYRLACFTALAFSLGLTCCAIAIARRCAVLLFVVGLLPTTLMIFCSVSQEVTIFPASFLLIAWLDRLFVTRDVPTRGAIVLAAAGLVLCISSRPPYAGLLLLLFCPQLRLLRNEKRYAFARRVGVCAAIAIAAALLVAVFGRPAWTPAAPPRSVGGQLHHLLEAPWAVWGIAQATFHQNSTFYYQSFVGILGWLDMAMSPVFYSLSLVMMGAALLMSIEVGQMDGRDGSRELAWWGASKTNWVLVALALLATTGMIFGSLYLTWTPVGATVVEGVQGRYFTAIFPLLALLLPTVSGAGFRWLKDVQHFLLPVVTAFFGYSYIELIRMVIGRYYLA